VEELDARGIPYRSLPAEEQELGAALADLPPRGATVLRVSSLDRRTHAGEATLEDLASLLGTIVRRDLSALLSACRSGGRPLVLTTDHGLSLVRGRLTHGRGGVWERALFLLAWHP
jgi:hypothetical protein